MPLLCGYLYTYLLARRLSSPLLARLHLLLLAVSLCLLPAIPVAHWKPRGDEEPIIRILAGDFGTVKQAAAEAQDRLSYDLAQDHTTRHRRRGFRRDREDQLELAMALREWKEYVKANVSAELCGA